jgi:transcriptional regulator with XRE-family HTH domain
MQEVEGNSAKIRFAEILGELVLQSPYRRNRRALCEKLRISPTALSQYVNGRSIPRPEVLIEIATVFGVSLDYLLLGRDPAKPPISEETRSLQRYLDWALADVQAKVGQRSWMAMQVGRVLGEQIDKAVAETVNAQTRRAGMLSTDEQLVLEHYAEKIYMLTPHLSYDIIALNESQVTAGRFGRVVADNLRNDSASQYQILIPEDLAEEVMESVHEFRTLLTEELRVPRDRLENWQVRTTKSPMLVGSCFYKLDMDALQEDEPMLELALREFVTSDNWICYSIHDTDEVTRGEILVAAKNVSRARSVFESLWRSGSKAGA